MTVDTNKTAKPRMQIPPEISALLAALQLQEPDTTLLKTLGDQEWRRLLVFSDAAQLTLLIGLLPLDSVPNWVLERVNGNLTDNALRFERIKSTYREAADVLAKAGVEHIVIKGFTQAPDYVVDPTFRSQSDLDLLFRSREDIEAARGALHAIGYRSLDTIEALGDHEPALERLDGWQWRGNRFDPEMPLQIELHFCLWNEKVSLIRIPEVSLFWERRTRREVAGLSFPCLNPVDHFGHLAIHLLRNILHRGRIIRQLRELAVFLHTRANDETFWQCWSTTHSLSLRSFQAIAFYYARAWFGCQLNPHVERAISSLAAARRSWLDRFSSSSLGDMFQDNKDNLWLHLTFLSLPIQRWKVIRQTLIPPRLPYGSLAVQRLSRSDKDHPVRQYIAYLIPRTTSHLHANVSTLSHGLSWYLSC